VSHSSTKKNRSNIKKHKRNIKKRLNATRYGSDTPVMAGRNIHYEVSDKMMGIGCGGIGVVHQLLQKTGFAKAINDKLHLLKNHVPYHESDHVLNIAYNALVGNVTLEDIKRLRSDEAYLNALGASRIPDSSTAGDFTRRFTQADIEGLMDAINTYRTQFWKMNKSMLDETYIDIDATVAPTTGECKQGMDMSYDKQWGYHPLIVSLANTQEILYIINRPGNKTSHDGAASWLNRAIDLVSAYAKRITLRGDTAFSLTRNFDAWSERVDFLFGMSGYTKIANIAENIDENKWQPLQRKTKYEIVTTPRQRPVNEKEPIVVEREYKNIKLVSEEVCEIEYTPNACKKSYRMVILKKNLSIEKGEAALFDKIKYFFYITTRRDLSVHEVVQLSNERCNQENVISQLKSGVSAMRLPVDNLLSNWAYMVIASQAWNFKSWLAMTMSSRAKSLDLIKMEFRTFLNELIRIPCQIIRQGGRIIYRTLGYSAWLGELLESSYRIRRI
jgi:hypothetical protein